MIKDYWGEFANGRLAGKRFFILWIILIIAIVVFGLVVGASIGLAEKLIGGNIAEAQAHLRENFSLPAIVIVAVIGILALVAKLNIIAKRARDIGLPGWISAVVIAGLVGGATQYSHSTTGGGLGMMILIILALIPTDAIKRGA